MVAHDAARARAASDRQEMLAQSRADYEKHRSAALAKDEFRTRQRRFGVGADKRIKATHVERPAGQGSDAYFASMSFDATQVPNGVTTMGTAEHELDSERERDDTAINGTACPSAAASGAVDECVIEATSAVGDDTLELLAAKLLRSTVALPSSPAGVDDAAGPQSGDDSVVALKAPPTAN
jgi:hypothetical protein